MPAQAHGKAFARQRRKAQSTFASLALPVVVVSGGSIVWYNDAFSQDVLAEAMRALCLRAG